LGYGSEKCLINSPNIKRLHPGLNGMTPREANNITKQRKKGTKTTTTNTHISRRKFTGFTKEPQLNFFETKKKGLSSRKSPKREA